MKKKATFIGLVVAVLFQCSVLAGEYLGAVHPLWTGKEIRVKTVPVDPRSLFRGNYARLRYDFSTVEGDKLKDGSDLRAGEVVYVKLKPGDDGLYVFDSAGLKKPDHGIFLRGRVEGRHFRRSSRRITVRYGIEAYFAPTEKARALEKDLRRGGTALLMVAGNGKAALKTVSGNGG